MDRRSLELNASLSVQHTVLDPVTTRCRVLGRFNLLVDTRDKSVAPHLIHSGFWESWVTLAIASALRPGMVAVDAGANFGYYSLLMADRLKGKGSVLAVEPNPRISDLLQASVRENGLEHLVQVSRAALWDEPSRELTLKIPSAHFGSGSLVGLGPLDPGETLTEYTVVSETLDNLLPRADFVKIDCEGAEKRIWRGMKRLREENPALVVCAEYGPNNAGAEFLALLREEGMRVRVVQYDGSIGELRPEHLKELRMIWITRS